MFDCANVEIRELLPEMAAGTLDAATRARVEAHLSSCAECASELETLRSVRSAYDASIPAIDVGRITAALPSPVSPRVAPAAPAPVKRWLDWRIAAALTMITVGGLSLAVVDRLGGNRGAYSPAPTPIGKDSPVVVAPPVGTSTAAPQPSTAPVAEQAQQPVRPTRTGPAKEQLAFGGGIDDLDDASIRALLGALDEIDRAPVAPSEEPDRTPLLPVIKEEGSR